MKIYIAAPWVDRKLMPEIARIFESHGHEISHAWWEVEDLPEWRRTSEELEAQARNDLYGVMSCERLVLFNTSKSEGKAVEQGIAICADTPIIGIGKLGAHSANVFHYLKNYTWVDNIEEAIKCLQS